MSPPRLFQPLRFGGLTLPNRIVVSPMCQYSAVDGNATDWHTIHLGSLAISGAGMLCLEATAVAPEGRITHGCLGLYNDENQAALQRVVQALRSVSNMPLAIQLAHAGRKASVQRPWEGNARIAPGAGGWVPVAPAAIPHQAGQPAPREMSPDDIRQLVSAFVASARRAHAIGFDAIELHMAHGYLLHQFFSPVSNQRTDEYGGSPERRMRLPLEVCQAVIDAVGADMAVGVRLSGTDWVSEGADIDQAIALGQRLEALGCSFLDVSTGGLSENQIVTTQVGPGYQVPFAAAVKRAVGIPVIAVGIITQPRQAEEILGSGQADAVALARGVLLDPRWPWRAAAELGATLDAPPQLWRAIPRSHPRIFKTSRRPS
ncbi:MAG: NADH:flavin oxidoreductase/NADH oxidase [Lautropia sp.]